MSRIREFRRMNHPIFIGSNITEDLENFVEELQKVFDIMYVSDAKKVELVAYQFKGVIQNFFYQWKKGRVEGAQNMSWAMFKEAFLRRYFTRKL